MSLDEFKNFSNEMAKKVRRKRDAELDAIHKKMNDHRQYNIEDFGIRKRGDHFESYNKRTGKKLFEACTWMEAWEDLKEEFLVGA